MNNLAFESLGEQDPEGNNRSASLLRSKSREGEEKRDEFLMVTAVQVLSEDDYSDQLDNCTANEPWKELTELQLAFDETFSTTKDFEPRIHDTPEMGFVEKQEARQQTRRRKVVSNRPWQTPA